MKIGLLGPVYPYRGGIAHYTTMLARALSERHEVVIISFKRLYPDWLYPGASDRDPSHSPLSVEAEYMLDPLAPWTWQQVFQHLRHLKPDLVIIPWWTTFLAPMTAELVTVLQRVGIRVSILIHNVLPHDPRPWDVWLTRWALNAGRVFVVQTEREKARLLALFPKAIVTVTPHPLYEMFTEQTLTQSVARERLKLPEEVPIALFFGIVRPYKGLKYLLEAIAQVRNRGVYIHLVVAGEFWENRASYDQQIQNLHLSEQVHLFPRYIPNEDVSLFFSAANMFVAPYITVTQSGVIKLALGFGLPVVTTRLGETESLAPWIETGQVQLVDPKDVSALADAIITYQHPNRKDVQYARTASPLIQFTWTELALTFEKLIHTHL